MGNFVRTVQKLKYKVNFKASEILREDTMEWVKEKPCFNIKNFRFR